MQKHKGISQTDVIILLVIVCVVVVLGIPLMAYLQMQHHPECQPCASNLRGLGTAMMVYGLDYDDEYPIVGGKDGPWSKTLGWGYDNISANYFPGGAENTASRTITASWYLLVREADVDPGSFVCRDSSATVYENNSGYDLTELWDFGPDPHKHVSYAMQNPYGKFPATGTGYPGRAVAADMSPWFKDGDIVLPASGGLAPQLIDPADAATHTFGNSLNHGGVGQNVLFGDGHVEFTQKPNVGFDNDNIYTYWSNETDPTADDKQIGTNPTARDKDNDSKSDTDSFLAI